MSDLFNLFELKKDISTPNGYMRAGDRKTKEEWETLFPRAFDFHSTEWFIDLEKEKKEPEISMEDKIVDKVFNSMGLHSMSYREAAVKCIKEYQLQTYLQEQEAKSKTPHIYQK